MGTCRTTCLAWPEPGLTWENLAGAWGVVLGNSPVLSLQFLVSLYSGRQATQRRGATSGASLGSEGHIFVRGSHACSYPVERACGALGGHQYPPTSRKSRP